MKKRIKIIEEKKGCGPIVQKGDKIQIRYNLSLNKGNVIQKELKINMILGDRDVIAGLNYGIEGMQEGGKRKFRASSHLCYKDVGIEGKVPPNAVLIFDLELVKIINT